MSGRVAVRYVCFVPVNGGYDQWSAWSSCTKTCEGGVQSRSRLCNDPVPDQDGLPCVGPSRETRDCNEDRCPGNIGLYSGKYERKKHLVNAAYHSLLVML